MKGLKKIRLVALGFMLFAVASCDNNSSYNNNSSNNYNLEDNELSKKIYDEYDQEFHDSSYNSFLNVCTKKNENNETSYRYLTFTIILNSDGSFKSKNIIKDNINSTYEYINNKWIKTNEKRIINEKEYETLAVNKYVNGSFYDMVEYSYDDKGILLNITAYDYIDDELIKIYAVSYINDKKCPLYEVILDDDNSFKEKKEFTYNENGNILSETISKYEDKWVYDSKTEYTYDSNGNILNKLIYEYKVNYGYNDEWVYVSKTEYTHDSNGKDLIIFHRYIKNEWILASKSIVINEHELSLLFITFKDDGSFDIKNETTYDGNGNLLSWIQYYYDTLENEWRPLLKKERTYDEKGNLLTKIECQMSGIEWIYEYIVEYTYDEKGNTLTGKYIEPERNRKLETTFDKNGKALSEIRYEWCDYQWVERSKVERTYDENGNMLTETFYEYTENGWTYILN